MKRSTISASNRGDGALARRRLGPAAPTPRGPARPRWTRSARAGQLLCGTASNEPGFALADSQGVIRGIDADTCRAVGAAVLGDVGKVKFVPTTTQNRFTALQSGEVDMLSRRTTWTLAREANLGLEFAWVNYYDGTGFLVKKSSGVKSREGNGRRDHLRAAGHQHRTRDRRLLPAEQAEVARRS